MKMTLRKWLKLVEQETSSPELDDLYRQRDDLMKRWSKIIAAVPENKIGAEYDAWYNDTENGGLFWRDHIFPTNKKIEKLEDSIRKERRTKSLVSKRDANGFDTSEILYHGTNAEFETFDRRKAKTASHIYTSPDIDTARQYGENIYAVYGRQQPQAVLTAEDMDYQLIRRLHRRGAFKRGWGLSLAELTELISDGNLYNYSSNSRLQDDVIDTCFSMKFRSVRISDGVPGSNGYSDSVIFEHETDLEIVEKVE